MKMLTTCEKWEELPSVKRLIKIFQMYIRFYYKTNCWCKVYCIIKKWLCQIRTVSGQQRPKVQRLKRPRFDKKDKKKMIAITKRQRWQTIIQKSWTNCFQGTDYKCENDYSDISSECDTDFSVQDEGNLEQAGVWENTEPKQGETRNEWRREQNNRYLRFDSENFTAESFSLNRLRIIETHLYINLLWSVVIFIRYVLRIQYTLMRTIFQCAVINEWHVNHTSHGLQYELPFLRVIVPIAC